MDYSALAKQFGGTTVTPASGGTGNVDYSALAKQYGGKTVTPPQSQGAKPQQPQGIFSKYIGAPISNAANSGWSQVKQSFTDAQNAKNPLQALESGGTFLGGVAGIAASPLAPVLSPVMDKINQTAANAPITNNPTYQKFAMSKTGQNVARAVTDVSNLNSGAGLVTGFMGGSEVAPKAANAVIDTTTRLAKDSTNVNNVGKLMADMSKINEMISPKPTIKETRIAQSEGRLVKGKPATLLKSGTPDAILPSDKTQSASMTILKKIPNAAKMNPVELYNAVDQSITQTAEALRPQMDATPIKPRTIQKLNDDWNALKETQMKDAPATEEANVAKRQAKFEDFLRKSGNENQGHLWDTRIAYDKSIPRSVKTANSMSPESLQLQKAEWLQNRAILNNAITDTASGMGLAAQQAFKDMTDLYEARTGLQTRAKLNTKIEPSGIKRAYNSKPGRVIRGALKLGGAGEILKHTGL